jgi:hypothetical protein
MLIPLLVLATNEKEGQVSMLQRIIVDTISGAFVLALFILPIELQIAWNQLDGVGTVSSTGQLLALTIGAFSLFRVGWIILSHWPKKEATHNPQENPDSAPPSPSELERGEGDQNAELQSEIKTVPREYQKVLVKVIILGDSGHFPFIVLAKSVALAKHPYSPNTSVSYSTQLNDDR